ncbi:unnamed protein product [Xylocopa violacea]|uniref:Leucine-rich repeat protein n=1 Tax=Xylocopa violacea TaxID=135666 RepID=A0ABP1NVR1_XYLVO
MDNFVDNRGRESNNKRELCLFYSTIISFEKLLFAKKNIRTLMIIGQRDIASFSAISELIELQELWIVECGIKNLEILPQLQELNLADNKLKRINKISWKKSDLQDLNLAGNPLCLMRDIRRLSQLQQLNSLVLSDPLYGDCPLVTLCNYRIYVIHHLPHIKKLDHYKICENERYWINYFFKKQVTYYNVLLHKQLNMHLNLLKHKYKEYKEEMIYVKNQLYAIEMRKNEKITLNLMEKYNSSHCEVLNESQNIMLRIKLTKKELVELEEILIMQLKILQQQLLINIYYCGNINFVEYNSTSENTVIELCRQYLQASLCPVIKKTNNVNDCLHVKYANNENNSYEICQTFQLMSLDIKNPMFIIEFEYVLQEVIEKEEHKNVINTCVMNNTTSICLSNSNFRQYVSINQKMETYNLVKICISGQNINSIDTDFDLPKLQEFDISYNQLHEFPNVRFIKNVKILNISFNNIKLLHIKETLPMLEELDVSWNLLMSCIQSISTFTSSIPNMYNLKIYNNPFNDVCNSQLVEYLIYIYLPKLQFINNCKCKNLNLPQNYFPCAFHMCKLNNKRCNKQIYIKKNMVQMKLLEKKNIEQAKYIHISQDFIAASNVLKRMKSVQEFCATCCLLPIFAPAKPLNHLIKLNLGNNFISILDGFTQENFPALKYLDLTNNLITSLASMGSFYTLQEFYCGNNKIKDMAQIDNIKTWQRLRVIDFCNNPINTDALHKKFIIFHLCNIE